MMAGGPIVVASSVDANFLPAVGPLISSMARFASPDRPVDYRIFYSGPESAISRALDGYESGPVSVRIIRPGDDFARFEGRVRTGTATLIRLSAAELMQDVRRVVYVDADLIFLDDIGRLFDLDLMGCPVGAVRDFPLYKWLHSQQSSRRPDPVYNIESYLRSTIGLSASNWFSYVNTGVAVMDLDALRSEDFGRRASGLIESMGESLLWPDQDVINILAKDRIAILDTRWNVQVKIFEKPQIEGLEPVVATGIRAQRDQQSVVHFSAAMKPWLRTAHLPFSGDWWYFADRGPTATTLSALHRDVRRRRHRLAHPMTALATAAAGFRYGRRAR